MTDLIELVKKLPNKEDVKEVPVTPIEETDEDDEIEFDEDEDVDGEDEEVEP